MDIAVGLDRADSPGSNRVRRVGVRTFRDLFGEHALGAPLQVCSTPGVDCLVPLGLPHRMSGHCDAGQCVEILSGIHALAR